MDVIEHECYQDADYDRYDGSRYIGLEKEEHDHEDKEDDGHESSRETVESVGDIDGVDDRYGEDERDQWGEEP